MHLAYARERIGHALIAARQWIPREQLEDPAQGRVMRLRPDLVFRIKGQLAIDLNAEVLADGVGLDFVCGDEVYGSCTALREYLEARSLGYVLRVPSNFYLTRGPRGAADLQAGRSHAAGRPARLGGPLGRGRRQGLAPVRLGVAGHRLVPALPAHPPPPGHRRAGLPRHLLPDNTYGKQNRRHITTRKTRIATRLRAIEHAYRTATGRHTQSAVPEPPLHIPRSKKSNWSNASWYDIDRDVAGFLEIRELLEKFRRPRQVR